MNPRIPRIAFVVLLLAACAATCPAADWPMWRCDAGRTASTDQELPAELHLQWVRQYPALEPMGMDPGDKNVSFETIYSPIVLGQTMFVGSSVNDSVTAIDVETGEEEWKFYTEGPVRLAPAGWKNRIYVVSDDGHLYCLDAAKGTLVWKFRGAPRSTGSGQAMKHRILGDERLISAWPARSGPVVADDRVYFSAGIFPFTGLYVYALDAETGKTVWVNDRRGAAWEWNGKTTAPQGATAVIGSKLLLSDNRLSVTCLDRETGEFQYCVGLGRPFSKETKQSWRICGAGEYFFTESTFFYRDGVRMHALETGNRLGTVPGSMPALSNGALYWAQSHKNTREAGALDLTKVESVGKKNHPAVKIADLWRLAEIEIDTSHTEPLRVGIRAGSRLYLTNGKRIVAVGSPAEGQDAKVSWSGTVEGRVEEMLAAAGRLFAVTREGAIHCFGGTQTTPKTYETSRKKLPAATGEWSGKVETILEASGVRDGYALVLGIGSGKLLEQLLAQSNLTVIGVDPDAAKVDALRRRLDAAGLYGKRAAVVVGAPMDCGLPPYVASLIVSEDAAAAGIEKGPAFARVVFHSLRPYGGVACIGAARVSESALKGWVASATLENAEVSQAGEVTLLTRAGALPGSAPWTHEQADPGNTVSSRDDLVKAPLGLLWFGGPSTDLAFDRHLRSPRAHVVSGRVIILGRKGLAAVDVYTGRVLWRTNPPEVAAIAESYPLPGSLVWGVRQTGSSYVSLPDGIYVANGRTCAHLDPATGKKLSEITLPDDGKMEQFGPIRIWEDVLVAGVDPIFKKGATLFAAGMKDKMNGAACRRVAAFDRTNGQLLWSHDADQGFNHNAIAVGDGKVFCIDRWSMDKGPRAEIEGAKLIALDARTGKELWRADENAYGTWAAFSPEAGIVIQDTGLWFYNHPHRRRCIAYRAGDGEVLWDNRVGDGPLMLNGTMLITQSHTVYDLRTGEKVKQFHQKHGGDSCSTGIGNAHLIVNRGGSAVYFDMDTGVGARLGGIRSGCTNTMIPADGVLNHPFFSSGCGCPLNVRTPMALIHMPELVAAASGTSR